MFERFTERARQVVVLAQEEARSVELRHDYIGTEHLLLGLLREQEGLAAQVLESFEITIDRARTQVVRIVGAGETVPSGQIPFTPRARAVLEAAGAESAALGHNYVGTDHLLLGLAHEDEGVATRILLDFDAKPEKIRDEIMRRLGGLPNLLAPLGAEIRAELGRAPDVGDLLLACACVPHTPAAQALSELGIDVDRLWAVVERARTQNENARDRLARRMLEVAQAKEKAIEEGELEDAARLRDQERGLREQVRAYPREQLAALDELRHRLALPSSPTP